jgi:uncharacterized membrane protein YozB (DUF420 family)
MAETTQAKPSRWTGAVKKTKKVLRWTFSLLIIFLVIFVYFRYFFTYSEGYRAGLLQKFSNKGVVFKTYEGELILSSVSSTANVALASEKFIFSVNKKHVSIQYDTLQGKNVIVHYIEKRGTVPWRGDSKYLVDSIAVRK